MDITLMQMGTVLGNTSLPAVPRQGDVLQWNMVAYKVDLVWWNLDGFTRTVTLHVSRYV